ncbi:hypothetical protein HanIR_Chr17g0874921 [Helianthus annuus]|nr:hypothetical protein HanIR_Chr17g0874921 [Helianthus annuus]
MLSDNTLSFLSVCLSLIILFCKCAYIAVPYPHSNEPSNSTNLSLFVVIIWTNFDKSSSDINLDELSFFIQVESSSTSIECSSK